VGSAPTLSSDFYNYPAAEKLSVAGFFFKVVKWPLKNGRHEFYHLAYDLISMEKLAVIVVGFL